MADRSAIEWTDATWNPVRGCTRVSPGCVNCYAERVAARFSGQGLPYHGLADMRGGQPRWTGALSFGHDLDAPLRWRGPRRIFVNSMSDLFLFGLEEVATVFAVAVAAHILRGHVLQILTKRSAAMRAMLADPAFWDQVNAMASAHVLGGTDPLDRRSGDARARLGDYGPDVPPPGLWLGVSAEDQRRADERIPDLLATPAAVRFVSAEPLLGPLDLRWAMRSPIAIASGFLKRGSFAPGLETLRPLDWIIVGGESGPSARPMHPDWARSLRDQCAAADVPFLFKQHGEFRPLGPIHADDDAFLHAIVAADARRSLILCDDGRKWPDEAGQPPDDAWMMERVGKARAGRLLDGVAHDGMPA